MVLNIELLVRYWDAISLKGFDRWSTEIPINISQLVPQHVVDLFATLNRSIGYVVEKLFLVIHQNLINLNVEERVLIWLSLAYLRNAINYLYEANLSQNQSDKNLSCPNSS